MKVQAQICIYTLRTQKLSKVVDEFKRIFAKHNLTVETSSMSSVTTGESSSIFDACRECFDELSASYDVVMEIKISNACPL